MTTNLNINMLIKITTTAPICDKKTNTNTLVTNTFYYIRISCMVQLYLKISVLYFYAPL